MTEVHFQVYGLNLKEINQRAVEQISAFISDTDARASHVEVFTRESVVGVDGIAALWVADVTAVFDTDSIYHSLPNMTGKNL